MGCSQIRTRIRRERGRLADDLQTGLFLSTIVLPFLMRRTLLSIGDAGITIDAEGRVTFLNPVAQSLTGWSQDKALKPQDNVANFSCLTFSNKFRIEVPRVHFQVGYHGPSGTERKSEA